MGLEDICFGGGKPLQLKRFITAFLLVEMIFVVERGGQDYFRGEVASGCWRKGIVFLNKLRYICDIDRNGSLR